MANKTHYFFYAPSWDYPPPPRGPIQLGNVITSIRRPEQPLYTAALPSNSDNSDSPDVYSSYKSDVKISSEQVRQGNFAVLTQFLSVLGVGVDVGGNLNRSDGETLKFDTITTTQFNPKLSYIQEKCIDASPAVQRWLERSHYLKPLYIIIGLKVVTGNKSGFSQTTRDGGGDISAKIDGTIWSGGTVPIAGGPKIEVKKSNKQDMSWGNSDDFVLAFRVKRVKVVRKMNEAVREDDYRKGTMLGNEVVERKASDYILTIDEDEKEEEGDDVGVDSGEWERIHVSEGDENVAIAIPRTKRT